jgi:cysteinyl-tRNA synthetase
MNVDYLSICRKYEKEFFHDMNVLNVLPPTARMRVTEHVPQIVCFVQRLIDQGMAYKTSDGKHFSHTHEIASI